MKKVRSNKPKGNLTRRKKSETKQLRTITIGVVGVAKTSDLAEINHLIIFVFCKHEPRAIYSTKLSKCKRYEFFVSVLSPAHDDDDFAVCSFFLLPMQGECAYMLTCRLKHKQTSAVELCRLSFTGLLVTEQCGKYAVR